MGDWSRIHTHRQHVFGLPHICLQGIIPARDLGRRPFDVTSACPSSLGMTAPSYSVSHAFVWIPVFMYWRLNRTLTASAKTLQTIMRVQQRVCFFGCPFRLYGAGTRLCGFILSDRIFLSAWPSHCLCDTVGLAAAFGTDGKLIERTGIN